MLIPQEWDLALYPGFQWNPLFEFFEDDARRQPFDLTGYSAQITIASGLLVLSSAGGGLLITAAQGAIQAQANAAQTAGLPAGQFEWVLSWTPSGGQPDCPAFGTVLIGSPTPTRR